MPGVLPVISGVTMLHFLQFIFFSSEVLVQWSLKFDSLDSPESFHTDSDVQHRTGTYLADRYIHRQDLFVAGHLNCYTFYCVHCLESSQAISWQYFSNEHQITSQSI